MIRNGFTVDLEDWFQGLTSTNRQPERWPALESRLEENAQRLLALLDQHQVTATFFVLGTVAEQYPELIRRIDAGGHRVEGVDVESVLVDDDVAVQDSLYTAGRRGVGTTVLMEKIAGAAAEEKRPLADVAAVARKVNDFGRTMGMALTGCTPPAKGQPIFTLAEDEMVSGAPTFGGGTASTAPFSVTSSYLVTSLNADLLDSLHAADYPEYLQNGLIRPQGIGQEGRALEGPQPENARQDPRRTRELEEHHHDQAERQGARGSRLAVGRPGRRAR